LPAQKDLVEKKRTQLFSLAWPVILLGWVALVLALAGGPARAADKYPPSQGTAVNDFAHVIDPANAAKMEGLSREILEKTGAAVVVVTVRGAGAGRRNHPIRQWSVSGLGHREKRRR
jgi:hypothetical protein